MTWVKDICDLPEGTHWFVIRDTSDVPGLQVALAKLDTGAQGRFRYVVAWARGETEGIEDTTFLEWDLRPIAADLVPAIEAAARHIQFDEGWESYVLKLIGEKG